MNLTCTMTYYALGLYTDDVESTISWNAAAGTVLKNTLTPLTLEVSGTLQVVEQTTASGSEVPSYDCTATFAFTDDDTTDNDIYATNEVSYTCSSAPVPVCSMY